MAQSVEVEVEVVESGLVVPTEETPNHPIWLSNLDLLVARAHTPTVYFYRRPPAAADFFPPAALRESLARTLVPFYPLAGRLGLDRDGRVEIRCTGEGVLFAVARSESNMDELGDFAPSDEMRRLLVPSVASGEPPGILVMIQVTFFKCGGVCLGAAVHHTAADGLGALHFINTWSDIARGAAAAAITTPPFLDRTLLRARSPPTILFDHVEYSHKPPAGAGAGAAVKPPFASAILKLSKDHLNTLKTTTSKPLSTFRAVVAHVWRSACKARQLKDHQETRLYMTADARSRVRPPLPPGYLGNAIFRASALATAGEVISSLEAGAEKVQSATARLDDGYVRSLVDLLEAKEDVRGLQKGKWVMPETDLWVISWQGLPIHDADFGWGRPVFMGRACLQFAGLVYIMQNPSGAEDGGGISVAVALEPHNMQRFQQVFYEGI